MPYLVKLTAIDDVTLSVVDPATDAFIEDLEGKAIHDLVLVKDGFVEFRVTPDSEGIARITITGGDKPDPRELMGGDEIFYPEAKIAQTLLIDLREYKDLKGLAAGIKQANDSPG